MIFVTVGTHEQPFNRLLKSVDELIKNHVITEKVIMQTGYSTYKPKYAQTSKFIEYSEMNELMTEARIVITHGGPASFLDVISKGKPPIVVPRQLKFQEHVNDHQVIFTEQVMKKGYPIKRVLNIENLGNIIENYDDLSTINMTSHNDQFVTNLEKIVDGLF